MRYLVNVQVVVTGDDSEKARAALNKWFTIVTRESDLRQITVLGAALVRKPKKHPEPSKEMRLFLDGEIECNDADVNGWNTNLAHCADSLASFDNAKLAEYCMYQGTDKSDLEDFARVMGEEMDALVLFYGGEYQAGDLLKADQGG